MVNVKSPVLLHIKVLPFSTCIDFRGKLNLLRISDEYRFYHADGVFILPQMAQMDTDFYHADEFSLNTNFSLTNLLDFRRKH